MPRWWIPEYISLAVNVATLILIALERPFNLGRVLYWAGATVLVLGLVKMR